MRSLEKPNPAHVFDAASEMAALCSYRDTEEDRAIPAPAGHLVVATWNVANLGLHKRRSADYDVIAEMMSWFELIAVQEVADDLDGLNQVVARLPTHFAALFNDKGGNHERAAFIYDTRRVSTGPKIGEVAPTESERRLVKLPGVTRTFAGFNRDPYFASFVVEEVTLMIANAHLFYGPANSSEKRLASMEQRQLEAYAVGRWCDLRRRSKHRFTPHILAVGDFNLPSRQAGDAIFDALTERGLQLPPHETRIPGTNLTGDRDYDQIAFVPGLKRSIVDIGVFDFDGVLFADIWDPNASHYWRTCAKYYVSDHRPLWVPRVYDRPTRGFRRAVALTTVRAGAENRGRGMTQLKTATGMALAALLALTACGDDNNGTGPMPRVADLMAALGCNEIEMQDEPEMFAAETGRCQLDDRTITFSVYPSNEARDNAVSIAEQFGAAIVVGDRWYAFTDWPDVADTVAETLRGDHL